MTSREAKVAAEWKRGANEEVTVEEIKGTFYTFVSELVALRLFRHYNRAVRNPKTDVGYSENLGSWFFRLETA